MIREFDASIIEIVPQTLGVALHKRDINDVAIYEDDVIEYTYYGKRGDQTTILMTPIWDSVAQRWSLYDVCESISVIDATTVKQYELAKKLTTADISCIMDIGSHIEVVGNIHTRRHQTYEAVI
jgi:hypothetical protein